MEIGRRFVDLENIEKPGREQCRYDLAEKIYSINEIGAISHSCEGKYTIWDGTLYALAFLDKEPVFIINRDTYYLCKHSFQFSHDYEGNLKYRFKAIIDDKTVSDVKYRDPGRLMSFPFGDGEALDESRDFGLWVTETIKMWDK